ncbi:unnamed protein product [Absidia cylindrospora]
MSRFDLQSFARQLHANRLSVLQTRQSRMILTEEDEQELDRLLARKVTLGAVGSLSSPPPVPALPPVPASLSQPAPLTTPLSPTQRETEMEIDTSTTISGFKAMVIEPSSDLAGPIPYGSISSDALKKPSLLLQKLNDQHPSIRSKNTTFIEMAPLSPSLSDPSSFISPRRAPTPPSETSSPFSLSASLSSSSTSTSTIEKDHKLSYPVATTVTLGPAPTAFTVKKKSSWRANRNQLKTRDQPKLALPPSPLSPTATQLRQSISLDSLRDTPQSKDSWKLTKASATKPAIATSATTTKMSKIVSVSSSAQPSASSAFEDNSKKPKSRLFGSLRQASRSSRAAGEGAIRGLMRNFSSVGQRTQHQQQQQQQQQTDQGVSSLTDNSTMSRAAKAVIQHDVSNKKKPANKKSKTVSGSGLGQGVDVTDGMDDSTVQVTHTATSTKGGVRLLTNLLAKARSRRTSSSIKRTTQQVPLNDISKQDANTAKERNKVVRRTIIYVQPDALDFMKDGHLPPIPAPKNNKHLNDDDDQGGSQARISKDTTMDDASSPTIEYATATKLTRQTSRRKRLVEEPSSELDQPRHQQHTTTIADHKKWRLESVSEFNVAEPTNDDDGPNDDKDDLYDYYRTNDMDTRLEGLELREMSDGSVVWGIVKKQGNRKSFFASKALEDSMTEHQHQMELQRQQQEEQDAEKEHDQIEKSVLALMGLDPDSLDHFTARLSNASSSSSSSAASVKFRFSGGGDSGTKKTSSLPPPPIPKRSPRRRGTCQEGIKQQCNRTDNDTTTTTTQAGGLSVEEQLDQMMLSLKQSQL